MAVAAGRACLHGFDAASVDGVFFASTTYAFREKQAAALIARALDLRRDVQTADYGGTLRAGTTALRGALDAVTAGSARSILVIASDCRTAAPGSALEANFGDGAAAFLVGEGDAIAVVDGFHSVADEILDVWRGEGEPFVHSWEDRFVVQEGYLPNVAAAVAGLFERTGLAAGDFATFACAAPDARSHGAAARALRIAPEQLLNPLFGKLGNAGVAFAPLLLAAALEKSAPGDRIAVANYGDGADALALTATEHLEKLGDRRGVAWHLAQRRPVASYDRYLKARGLGATEWPTPAGPGLSATIHHRERDDDLGFRGQRCRGCDAVQFPAQRVCETCFRKDDFESVRLADRTGHVVTYTFDYFFPTPDPPTIVTVTEVSGARVHIQLVNCSAE
jgi:3-hydroxy-3-methylglutaryl CoA synthase